jgi:hypothetical protein
MKAHMKELIDKIKLKTKKPIPRVRFSVDFRNGFSGNKDLLDEFEGITILLENHPFHPFGREFSSGSDVLDYRRALSYDVIIRLLGHCRSLIANANEFNQIGTGVAVRCILELYAFLHYVKEHCLNEERTLEKLLHGTVFFRGNWLAYEKAWKEQHDEPMPAKFKDLAKSLLEMPRLGEYRNSVNDGGFDVMYSVYSNYVHPNFGDPRDQFLADRGVEPSCVAFLDAQHFYPIARNEPSPMKSLERDVNSALFCLGKIWFEVFTLDPTFDLETRE